MTDQELSTQKLAELREAATGWPVLAALLAERDRLAAAVERVRAIHYPDHTGACPECRRSDCDTIRTLDGRHE